MNYQLSSEEMAQVRRIIQILHVAEHSGGIVSASQERELLELAEKIKEWLK